MTSESKPEFTGSQLSPFEFIEDRQVRLEAINSFLSERGLRRLKSVGNFEDSQVGTEITAIRQVYDRPQRFYTVITFGAKFLGGVEGEYSITFKANGAVADGSVYVARINTKDNKSVYVLTNQYRIPHDERMIEFPRGFAKIKDSEVAGDEFDEPVDIAELTGARVLRELTEETGIKKIKRFQNLGKLAEDSSTHASDVNAYLVVADSEFAEQQLDESELGLAVVIMTPEELYGGLKEGKIRDMHSLSVLFTAILKDPEEGRRFAEFLLSEKPQ